MRGTPLLRLSLGAAVLAGLAVLFLLVRGPGRADPRHPAADAAAVPSPHQAAGASAAGARRSAPPLADRLLEDAARADPARVVVDHRGEPGAEPTPSPISGQSVADLRGDIRTMVKECGKPIRARDHRIRARLQVTLTVSVTGGRALIGDARLALSGVDDAEVLDCVRTAVVGANLGVAPGQEDVASHDVTMVFSVP